MTASTRMHDDEVPTDAGLVRRLIAEQFPRWAQLPLVPVASAGTDNALYRLGDDLVVRLPRIHWAADDVAKEQTRLPLLAPYLPVVIPEPIALGVPSGDYPWHWSVYRWLEGENPDVGALPEPEGLAEDIAAFVTALQGIDAASGPVTGRGVPLAERDEPTRAALDALGETVDRGAVTAAWESALMAPAWTGSPVWLHGDLGPGNLLCRDGRLHGVIDLPYYQNTNPHLVADSRRKIAAVLAGGLEDAR
ncbi:MAG: aminoglycoside phosphotransferase family protein [Trueperaceae bacterium]